MFNARKGVLNMNKFKDSYGYLFEWPKPIIAIIILSFIGHLMINSDDISRLLRVIWKVSTIIFYIFELLESSHVFTNFDLHPDEYKQNFIDMYDELQLLLIPLLIYFAYDTFD